MSGKFKFFQGQGIVREFYVVSGKNEFLLKCQGNVREFYNFQFVPNDEKQKMSWEVFLLIWIQAFKIILKASKLLNIRRLKQIVCQMLDVVSVFLLAIPTLECDLEVTVRLRGAQWLSGRVLDCRPRGRGFKPHRRHCVVVLEQDTFILA